jgi:glutamate dehydrogenase
LGAADREAAHRTAKELAAAGVPRELAGRVALLESLLAALDLVEVAAATGVGFEEAAGVYFAIDDRLELHALRALISALPREERWEALARRALWEDLHGEHRALTADVLRESESGPAAERLRTWIAHNDAAFQRCVQVLADVKAGGAADLATLSVAVREIRNLIDATAAPAREATQPVEQPAAPIAGS